MDLFDIVTHDWGKKTIELDRWQCLLELRPVEIHHKEDGTLDGGPSFAIVLANANDDRYAVVGQVSFDMLRVTLQKLGYILTRDDKNEVPFPSTDG